MEPILTRIKQKIKSFDICALLKLLKDLGYSNDDIYFQSNCDLSSYSSLCEDIFFSESSPKVSIILNIGLLSSNSPLPNFFRKKMDSGSVNSFLFTRFLSFFDHHAIKSLLAMSMPDINDIFFSSWREMQGHYLKLLDLNSTSTLWHLFRLCFPELIVEVVKFPRVFKQNTFSIMLGSTRLGVESFLGKKIEQTIPSFKFTLISEDTHTELKIPWPQEIKRRLKSLVFAIFQRTDIHFRVTFILKNNKEIAQLSRSCLLGYSTIGESQQFLKILLFSGFSKDLQQLS